jgi:hypothetical protein
VLSADPSPQDAKLTRLGDAVWNDLLGSWMGRIAQIVLTAGLGG